MLLRDLLNAGILSSDAQTLAAYFANETEFLDGLEQVARAIVTKTVTLIPPTGEPWATIYTQMATSGQPPDQVFSTALAAWPPDVQAAISGAISRRIQDIQQWQQQQGPSKRRKTAQYIKMLKSLGFSFKLNLVTYTIELNGKKMTDIDHAMIRNRMRDLGIFEVKAVFDAYWEEAYKNRYHPVRDYLTSLKFEGRGDPIGELANHFTCEYGMFETWLRRWMIGACAKVMQAEENRMLVLDGPQNVGKSYFVRWLASPLPEYFIEGGIDASDEDMKRRLGQRWIWEVSELGATTRKSDWEALKAFITQRTVTTRLKYDREDTDFPALASMIGTINNEEGFLPVGDRRFYVERITKINWNYTQIDVDQLWAQAFDLYLAGEPWEPQGNERNVAAQINEDYRMIDIVEETIKNLFEIDLQQTWQMSTLEIVEILKSYGLKSPGELDSRKLSRALTKLGLEKARPIRIGGKLLRGYYGIRKRVP
ncbi:hypothetical protein C4588_04310 [Candidatus Parcubacteria bacterium]|jgi:hypothetical protein|nr:MAG: hypothetical protein C4588_04310 [Candidatus Parcubacteria bacterium]